MKVLNVVPLLVEEALKVLLKASTCNFNSSYHVIKYPIKINRTCSEAKLCQYNYWLKLTRTEDHYSAKLVFIELNLRQ